MKDLNPVNIGECKGDGYALEGNDVFIKIFGLASRDGWNG